MHAGAFAIEEKTQVKEKLTPAYGVSFVSL